jgi:hypothetical protein
VGGQRNRHVVILSNEVHDEKWRNKHIGGVVRDPSTCGGLNDSEDNASNGYNSQVKNEGISKAAAGANKKPVYSLYSYIPSTCVEC